MKKIAILVILLLVSSPAFLWAAGIAGVSFKDTYRDQGITMTLRGTGLKTLLFFKAFVAAFYTAPAAAPDELGEVPKRVEVQYFVNIPGRKLNSYTIERMKANATPAQMQSVAPQTALMAGYFVDLKPGDRFALTYIPGRGTSFEYNGKPTGLIASSLFARILFAVWVGDKPFDEGLKQALLGSRPSTAPAPNAADITPGYVSRIVHLGPAQTAMQGSIRYSVIGTYVAHFEKFQGSVALDEESREVKSVFLTIDADSIRSSCLWCDRIVRSARLLNAARYPQIIFKSNDIIREPQGYRVKGILELNGREKEALFPFTFDIASDAASGRKTLRMSGKWEINRKDFDIIWNALLDHGGILVGDIITVTWGINVGI